MPTPLTMNPTLGDLLKYEDNPNVTREVGTLLQSGAHLLGTVLGGKRVGGTVAVAAGVLAAGAAGNGTLTLNATPHTDEVKEGVYSVNFKSATKADVEDPDGVIIGTATVGSEFSKHIVFTLAAGGNAFAAGDRWTVAVSIAGGLGGLEPWDPAEADGVENVAGVLLFDTDATDADQQVVYLARGPAIVAKDRLIFVDGTTAAQKADAYAALSKVGITPRDTA